MAEYDFSGLDEVASKGPAREVAMNPAPSEGYDFSGVDEVARSEKFGTVPQMALSALEGAARGATLGLSDLALTKAGVPAEDIRAREEVNPVSSIGGNVLGGAALIAGTGGLAAPLESALVGAKVAPLAARGLAWGAEGALFGAGNTISDASLGDTQINAEKILTDVGIGAAFGSGLGLLAKGIEASPSLFRKTVQAPAVDSVEAAAAAPKITEPVVDAPGHYGIKPSSLEDIQARVKDAAYRGEAIELPAKEVLEDAASRVELLNPVHPLQVESMQNQAARDLYQTAKEMAGKEGDALRSYEALQKQELTKLTDKTIESLAPEAKVTGDAVQGGNKAIQAFTENYQREQKALAPIFESFKGLETADPMVHLPGVVDKMTDAVPGVSRMLDVAGGEISVKPYKTAYGIDKATYTAVKDAVESLNEGATSIKDLMNIRKGLEQNIDKLASGQGPAEIRRLQASMMDYIQGEIEKIGAATGEKANIREVFKRYAINEQERQVIEKAFGASVGSQEFGALSKIKPEEISDKIFRNTATTKAAKSILDPKTFNELLANHLAEQRALATDKGAFSANKFGSYLKKNQDVLNEAFADNPAALQRLKDLNNITRILPDAQSINPSGTAKTLWGVLKAHSLPELLGNVKEFAKESLENAARIDALNQRLAGKADQATKLATVEKIIKKTNEKIDTYSAGIFSGKSTKSGLISGLTAVSTEEYNKRVNRIKELAGDANAMMDHLGKSTESLYAAAPNITQDIHNKMVASLQFLNSKIPQAPNHLPLSAPFKPSAAQMAKFNKYYDIVNEPVLALKQVQDGTLTYETIEALSVTAPKMLEQMRQSVVEKMDPEAAKNLPYSVKISLGKFLNQPLDENMLPQAIQTFQISANPMMQKQAPGLKPTVGGMKELDFAGRSVTSIDRRDEG